MIGKVQDRIKDLVYPKQYNVKIKSRNKADEWFQESQYLFKLGRYDEALKVCDNALESNVYNSDLFLLKGKIFYKLHRFEEALAFYKKALEIQKRDFGEKHHSIANTLVDIGELYRHKENYNEAISNYSIALDIQKRSLGSKHPDVAKTLNSLAELKELVGDLENALSLYKLTFDIQEFSLGYDHPEVANTLSNLGRLYTKLNKLDEALKSYERALTIQERIYSQQDPEVLLTLDELSKIYVAKNQLNEAIILLKRIIVIKKDAPNFEDVDIVQNLVDLGTIYKNSGKYDDARTQLLSAFDICKQLPSQKVRIVKIKEELSELDSIENKNSYSPKVFSSIDQGKRLDDVLLLKKGAEEQAWNDLIRLTRDEDGHVRSRAADVLASAFSQVPDKQQAWNDLIRLTSDEDGHVRSKVASALGSAFHQVPDKQQVWNDLHRLTIDKDCDVRREATDVLGSVFSQVPNKKQAWNDLDRLTSDENSSVKSKAALSLGSVYSQVPDKQKVWEDLYKLALDNDKNVRVNASYSLGKISIFKASQSKSEENYKKELENAIKYFERASKESFDSDSLKFCLPFYLSFYSIIFGEANEEGKINKYLTEARDLIKDSKDKKILFEAIENLANALKEVQILNQSNLEAKKDELNFYRKYCEQAAELMAYSERVAPSTTKVIRRGLPILDKKLKNLLEEIREKAKITCRESKGTDTEEIARSVNREVHKWEIGSQEYLVSQIENLVSLLKSYVPKIEENGLILNKIDQILQGQDVVEQYSLLNNLIPQIIDIQVSKKANLILDKKDNLKDPIDIFTASIDELGKLEESLKIIQRDLEGIKDEIPEMKERIDEVLYKLYSPMNINYKLKIAIPLITLLVSYEMEASVPKYVAEKIFELNNLALNLTEKKTGKNTIVP